MTEGLTTNFRGQRALVLHCDDVNRATLVKVLGRLGLEVTAHNPSDAAPAGLPDCDLLFFDADEDEVGGCLARDLPQMPTIGLIGSEAPSRLARVVGHRCDSHILKPVRNTGVFTALLLAVNGHRRRQRMEREIETLQQRLAGRREVMKAVLHLIAVCRFDEDTAYDHLRREAMNRRMPIEDVARDVLGLHSAEAISDAQLRGVRNP